MKFRLRPYQTEAVKRIEEEWKTNSSTLLVLPTAAGKTVTFSEVIRRAFPRRALILCHRKELVYQAREKVQAMTGWRVDIEMGESRADMGCMFGGPRVVVSTIQTQSSGGDGNGRMTRFDPRMFGVLVCDESHHSVSPQWKKVINWYRQGNPDIKILGVTATPDRADEEALGQVYETVAYDYEIQDAINDGWLVPVSQQMVNVEGLDFSSCRTTAGDLNGADLAKVMEQEEILQRVVSPTFEIIGSRSTIVFCASVDHAERMAEMFNRYKPNMAAWVCGETPSDEREKINRGFKNGDIQVVCNCGIYTEGADFPRASVIALARPTKSRSLYAQMAGRGLRPADNIAHELNDHESPEARMALIEASNKPVALLLDFVGNSGKHKLMTSVDILGGKITDEVKKLAVKKLKDGGKAMMVDDAIHAAEEELEEEKQKELARRARLKAKAAFKTTTINPFDCFDVKPVAERGWDKGKKLTDKQAAILRKQGIEPDALPYGQSKQLLNEMFRRWDTGMCSYKQSAFLRKRGLPCNVTKEEASRVMNEIATKEGWVKR